MACQLEHTEGGEDVCHATALDTCDFGTIDNCTLVVDSTAAGAEKVALNKDNYEIKTGLNYQDIPHTCTYTN